MRTTEHVHAGALAALLARLPHNRSKSSVAAQAGITPANLRELETGVRSGSTVKTRDRLAVVLELEHRNQVTCWCDRPWGMCLSLEVDQ